MIVDAHAHVAGADHLPERFLAGWADNVRAAAADPDRCDASGVRELLRGATTDPGCRDLLAQMAEAEIGLAVLLVVDFAVAMPETADAVERAHREVATLIADRRFAGFAGIDPRRGSAGVDHVRRALRDEGFSGVKLYPPCGYSAGDPGLFPLYEVCAERGAPVLVHTGPTSPCLSFRHTHPMDVDDAACRFPEVPFVLGHGASVWHEDAALLAEFRPNVYLDLSGFQPAWRRGDLPAVLGHHVRRGLHRKLVFGTDWPIYRLFGSQRDWVAAVSQTLHGLGCTADQVEDVMGRNMLRLLGRTATGSPAR